MTPPVSQNMLTFKGITVAASPELSNPAWVAGLVTGLAKRVIACLDVRANDKGDLVVTKGDQYDVRESSGGRDVRNLGAPVQLAGRYFAEGADEVTFLNITGFRDFPLGDMPMLEVPLGPLVSLILLLVRQGLTSVCGVGHAS